MKNKKKVPKPKKEKTEVPYTIRFRDKGQIALIKDGAGKAGVSFNFFVMDTSERVAKVLLRDGRLDTEHILTTAVDEAITER